MQGTVLRVEVADGDVVEAGQVLVIVEAMKMENEIRAHLPGVVEELAIAVGDAVRSGQPLLRVAPP
jgi:acetyl-CoA/propionyl-CoA carboxylase biotin carboxyl carrier protein